MKIDPAWLHQFDKAMLDLFAIDHQQAGLDETLLLRYADLPPLEAAHAYGSDYDLHRTGIWR